MASDAEITRSLGLRRPLGSYAPRTQRRYRAAFARGQTATQANKTEYQSRKNSPATKARAVAKQLRAKGLNQDGSHDPSEITELGHILGWEQALELLTNQLDATRAYAEGDTARGQQLWAERNNYEQHIDFDDGEIAYINLVPYTRYHGKR